MDPSEADWYIGGWADIYGNHHNVEKEGEDAYPDDSDLSSVDYLQIHITANDGSFDTWVTLHGPWGDGDWDFIYAEVDYFIENDGGS